VHASCSHACVVVTKQDISLRHKLNHGDVLQQGSKIQQQSTAGWLASTQQLGYWLPTGSTHSKTTLVTSAVLSLSLPRRKCFMSVGLLLTPTTVAGVKRSSASVCLVYVCLSVSPHDKTKTAETIQSPNLPKCPSWVLFFHLILSQKVNGHKVQKHVEDDRVAGVYAF